MSHELSAVVVDDEPMPRAYLARLLRSQGVIVAGDAETGAKAVELADRLRPDLLFVDVQMPEMTGMEVADSVLCGPSPPLIVFVTGYSEHAVAAFDRSALDYLVKPVSKARLAQTIARARDRLLSPPASGGEVLARFERLPIRDDYMVRFVRVDEIVCAEARDKRVFIHTGGSAIKTSYTLSHLEECLPQDTFLRIHESYIVNVSLIEELLFLGNHMYEIRLSDNRRVPVGRSRYAHLQRCLGLGAALK